MMPILFGGDDGLGGYMPLAVAANDNGVSQLSWVHGNHMGVPAVYTDASGSEIAMPTGYSAPGFPGQSRTFADLYHNRYRYYDPTTGRYIQADPIGLAGGPSPYSYAMNNPLRYTDPTGEFVPILVGIGIGVAFEYFTNECATVEDLLLAGAFGSIGGGVGGAGLKFGGRRLFRELWKDTSGSVPRRLPNKLNPNPNAVGPHTSFRRSSDGAVRNYETYKFNPRSGRFAATKRFRGTGKPHGGVKPPFVLRPQSGKGLGSPPRTPYPARKWEIPKGN